MFLFFQAEDGIRDADVTGVQTCALPICVVRAWQVLLANYAACGLLSAVAGLVLSGTVNAADLSLATVLLLPSVAAVVIRGRERGVEGKGVDLGGRRII